MPQIIKAPIRVPRSRTNTEGPIQDIVDPMFYEVEIEKNRQVPLPCDVSGYSTKAPMPTVAGSASKGASGTGTWRTQDEWKYGVTIYLP